jgi:beta-lactamase regulating signal transducer with metallopeptidase domain
MNGVFIKIFNMSLTASWLIAAVVILRFVMKKAPKRFMCVLWALVAVRLLCPFTIESVLSLVPSAEPIPKSIEYEVEPEVHTGIAIVNDNVNPVIAEHLAPRTEASVNPMQIIVSVASSIWLLGVLAMAAYAFVSWFRLKRRVAASIETEKNVYLCDGIESPFVLGVIRPVIYVPSGINGQTLENVLLHERAHIKRKDHIWKTLGYALLVVYWFNPLCWAAYILLGRDIEMACDEKVIRDMERTEVADYMQALLDCAVSRRRIAACPLAFGEVGIKERAKSILNYKKPAFWIVIVAVLSCIAVGIFFMTDPPAEKNGTGDTDISDSDANVDSDYYIYVEKSRLEGKVVDKGTDYIVIEPLPHETDVLKSADRIAVYWKNLKPDLNPEIGDTVAVEYDGRILESYPARFGETYSVSVMERASGEDEKIAQIRKSLSKYFELPTDTGLTVYFWTFGGSDYKNFYYGLLCGKDDPSTENIEYSHSFQEKMEMKGTSLETMITILSTYNISENDVAFKFWQNPLSSYGMFGEDISAIEEKVRAEFYHGE